jgi:hypothetical protein
MELTEQDRIDISDLINLHGHLTDAGKLDEAGELFAPDVTYDLIGHHVTNIVITPVDARSARVQSKGIGIQADGTAGSVVYDDIVTRQPGGWEISYRKVTARRAALGGRQAGAREVLERFRQAAISQSADDMSRLHAADAVHLAVADLPAARRRSGDTRGPARSRQIARPVAVGLSARPDGRARLPDA